MRGDKEGRGTHVEEKEWKKETEDNVGKQQLPAEKGRKEGNQMGENGHAKDNMKDVKVINGKQTVEQHHEGGNGSKNNDHSHGQQLNQNRHLVDKKSLESGNSVDMDREEHGTHREDEEAGWEKRARTLENKIDILLAALSADGVTNNTHKLNGVGKNALPGAGAGLKVNGNALKVTKEEQEVVLVCSHDDRGGHGETNGTAGLTLASSREGHCPATGTSPWSHGNEVTWETSSSTLPGEGLCEGCSRSKVNGGVLPKVISRSPEVKDEPLEEEKEEDPAPLRGFKGFRESVREVATLGFWRDCLCEMFIVFFMVFGSTMVTVAFPNKPVNIVAIGLAAGLFVFILIEGFAHIQLACMNPCAILAFLCTKRLGFVKAIFYLGFELTGSVLGAYLVYLVTPEAQKPNVQPLKLGEGMTELGGVTVEWVFTGLLVFVVMGALDRTKRQVYMPGLPIGITIGMGILASDQYTGGAMNPNIVFGPAAISGNWKHQWVYWVGDIGGTLNAILLYHFFTYDRFPFGPRRGKKRTKDLDTKKKMLEDVEAISKAEEANGLKKTGQNGKISKL